MTDIITLEDQRTRVRLIPALGGGIGDIVALTPDGKKPVTRPWSGDLADGPLAIGSNTLVPFSNRIFGGGFTHHGQFHVLPPNLAGSPTAIHGDGFVRHWDVVSDSDKAAQLSLENGEIGPFRYRATQEVSLGGGAVSVTLRVTNTSDRSLPFGGGFHPWFPRDDGTMLSFKARSVCLEPAPVPPETHIPVAAGSVWDFREPKAPPDDLIDHAFEGWDGVATLRQPSLGLDVSIRASERLTTAIVYSQGSGSEFVCFEPVSHPVNAINRPGRPGLVDLAPDEEFRVTMIIDWRHIGSGQT